jgi:hypothetical protein
MRKQPAGRISGKDRTDQTGRETARIIMSDYDGFAWFYEKYWGGAYYDRVFGVLEELLLKDLRPGARILDLCCGTGHLSVRLAERGFDVTGLDISGGMLAFAREKLPGAEFIQADARSFSLPESFAAAVSGFESWKPRGLRPLLQTPVALSYRGESSSSISIPWRLTGSSGTSRRPWSKTITSASSGGHASPAAA